MNTETYVEDTKAAMQPNFTKDPNKEKIYTDAPGSFVNQPQSTSSSPAITVEEEDEPHRELEKPHRTKALVGVEVEEAVGGRPSTGATPQALQLLDLSSPSATTAAEGRTSQI